MAEVSMLADPNALLTATQAAEAVGVSKQLFNYWRGKGYIQPDRDGLYRLGDVYELEERMRTSAYSKRSLIAA